MPCDWDTKALDQNCQHGLAVTLQEVVNSVPIGKAEDCRSSTGFGRPNEQPQERAPPADDVRRH
jgi:hypothetical protein